MLESEAAGVRRASAKEAQSAGRTGRPERRAGGRPRSLRSQELAEAASHCWRAEWGSSCGRKAASLGAENCRRRNGRQDGRRRDGRGGTDSGDVVLKADAALCSTVFGARGSQSPGQGSCPAPSPWRVASGAATGCSCCKSGGWRFLTLSRKPRSDDCPSVSWKRQVQLAIAVACTSRWHPSSS